MNRNYFWAAVGGSLASIAALFSILVISLFLVPETPEEYGEHLYGVGMLLGLILPISLCILFIYYLIIGLGKNKSFKFALSLQLVFIIPIVIMARTTAFSHLANHLAWQYTFYTFVYFSISAACGAWIWSRKST